MRRSLLLLVAVGVLSCALHAQSPTSTTISANAPTANYGDPVTYTGTVTTSGGGVMSSTVNFGTQGPNIGATSFTGTSQYQFGTAVNYATQFGAVDIAASDFNGDNIADLAVLNQCGTDPTCASGVGTISILKNNGSGTFGAGLVLNVASGAASMTATDVDADGHADLAVVNTNSGTLVYYFGTATGSFTGPFSVRSLASPTFVRSGVFTSSGRMDLIVLDKSRGQMGVHVNLGSRSFTVPTAVPVGTNPNSLVVGDFNVDGKQDVAVVIQGNGFTPANVSVFLGNGDGTFAAAQTFGAGTTPIDIGKGDFNGDGKLDLVVTDASTGNLVILLGKADGTFAPATTTPATTAPAKLVVADFNTDGVIDVAVSDSASKTVSVLLGNGDGTFAAPISSVALQSNKVQWAFTGVTFNDGGTVSGWFTYDPGSDLPTDWNFTSAGGNTTSFPVTSWLPANSSPNTFGPGIGAGTYQWTFGSTNHQIRFKFSGSLATSGTLSISPIGDAFANTECFNCSPFRNMSAGSVVGVPLGLSLVAADFNGGGLPDIAVTDLDSASVLFGSQVSTAVLTDNTLPAGTYDVHANYTGDPNFGTSASGTMPLTVFASTPSISGSADTPVALSTANLTLRAHVVFAVGRPTGTVSFFNTRGGALLGSGTVNAAGDVAVIFPATIIGLGDAIIRADYSGDTNFNPASAFIPEQITPVADVQVTAVAPSASVALGLPFTYTVNLSNSGPDPAGSVTVILNLPAGLTVVSVSPLCSGAFPQFTCSVGLLNSGTTAGVWIGVSAATVGNYTIAASVGHLAETDPNLANNTASATANVNGADLVLTSASAPTNSGGNTAYTVTVTNLGPSIATGVTLSDSLSRYNFISASSTRGSCSYNGIVVSCTIGNLVVNANATVTVVVSAPNSGWASNEFSVHGNEPDGNQNNNAAQLDLNSKAIAAPVLVARPSRDPTASGVGERPKIVTGSTSNEVRATMFVAPVAVTVGPVSLAPRPVIAEPPPLVDVPELAPSTVALIPPPLANELVKAPITGLTTPLAPVDPPVATVPAHRVAATRKLPILSRRAVRTLASMRKMLGLDTMGRMNVPE